MEAARERWRSRCRRACYLLAAFLGAGGGCGVDLEVPSPTGAPVQRVQIQIVFKNFHGEVSATRSGDKTGDPAGFGAVAGAVEHLAAESESRSSVVPLDVMQLAMLENLYPGRWGLRVRVTEGASAVIDKTCEIRLDSLVFGGGFHVLKVVEGPTPGEAQCACADVACPPEPAATRNAEMLGFPAPASVAQGEVVDIPVMVRNLGNIQERFTVAMTATPRSGGASVALNPPSADIVDLPPGQTQTRTFQWSTAGAAVGVHTLHAEITGIANETITSDNAASLDVTVTPPAVHDISLEAIAVRPSTVLVGEFHAVDLTLRNVGNRSETFTVSLTDTPAGGSAVAVGSSAPTTLGPPGSGSDAATISIPWQPAVPLGAHTLAASAPLPGDTTSNNQRAIQVVVEARDVEVLSVSVAAAASIGAVLPVTVSVRNNGSVNEDVLVNLFAQPPGGGSPIPAGTRTLTVNAGATVSPAINWDTGCLAQGPGSWSLSARVTALSGLDRNPANDSASSGPLALAVDRELSLAFVNPPATASGGSSALIVLAVTNGRSVAETGIGVSLVSARQGGGSPGSVSPPNPPVPADFACGERKEFTFIWIPPSTLAGNFDLTGAITTAVPGDSPGDNTATTTVNVP